MLRYEIIANVGISVDLHNNYTVVALAKWNKEKESYLATFYIKQTDIDHLDLMDDTKTIVMEETNRQSLYVCSAALLSGIADLE